jgi:hypothetical protein
MGWPNVVDGTSSVGSRQAASRAGAVVVRDDEVTADVGTSWAAEVDTRGMERQGQALEWR